MVFLGFFFAFIAADLAADSLTVCFGLVSTCFVLSAKVEESEGEAEEADVCFGVFACVTCFFFPLTITKPLLSSSVAAVVGLLAVEAESKCEMLFSCWISSLDT